MTFLEYLEKASALSERLADDPLRQGLEYIIDVCRQETRIAEEAPLTFLSPAETVERFNALRDELRRRFGDYQENIRRIERSLDHLACLLFSVQHMAVYREIFHEKLCVHENIDADFDFTKALNIVMEKLTDNRQYKNSVSEARSVLHNIYFAHNYRDDGRSKWRYDYQNANLILSWALRSKGTRETSCVPGQNELYEELVNLKDFVACDFERAQNKYETAIFLGMTKANCQKMMEADGNEKMYIDPSPAIYAMNFNEGFLHPNIKKPSLNERSTEYLNQITRILFDENSDKKDVKKQIETLFVASAKNDLKTALGVKEKRVVTCVEQNLPGFDRF